MDPVRLALDVRVHETRDAAVEAFCELVCATAPRTFVLTGGGVAADAYRLLASERFRERLDWPALTLYFGDERCVPPGSDQSNYRQAREALLDRVPAGTVERMRGEEADRDAEAARYAALLPERFDLLHLGMGDDGHCASLFPGEPSLHVRDRLCVPSHGHYAPYERLTLTFPALERARLVVFLVCGEQKADALAAIHRGEDRPATRVRPADGRVVWVVDAAAASGIA